MYVNMFKGSSRQILSRCREECIFCLQALHAGISVCASPYLLKDAIHTSVLVFIRKLKCFRQISFTKTRSSCSLGLPYCTFKQQVRYQLQKCGDSANKLHTTPLFISVTGCPSNECNLLSCLRPSLLSYNTLTQYNRSFCNTSNIVQNICFCL